MIYGASCGRSSRRRRVGKPTDLRAPQSAGPSGPGLESEDAQAGFGGQPGEVVGGTGRRVAVRRTHRDRDDRFAVVGDGSRPVEDQTVGDEVPRWILLEVEVLDRRAAGRVGSLEHL